MDEKIDSTVAIYHFSKEIERMNNSMERVSDKLDAVEKDIVVLRTRQDQFLNDGKRHRLKDSSVGGGLAALVISILYGLYEAIFK